MFKNKIDDKPIDSIDFLHQEEHRNNIEGQDAGYLVKFIPN